VQETVAVSTPIASGGGVTEAFIASLEMLRREGFRPVAIAPEAFRYRERLLAHGFQVETIAGLERQGAWRAPFQALKLARLCKRLRPAAFIVNNGRHVPYVRALKGEAALIAIYHGGKPQRFLGADHVLTINDPQREGLIAMGFPAARIAVIDNCLPVDHLPPFRSRAARRPPVIGTLRLLEPAKGVDVLIDAIAILARRGCRLPLTIGSSGSQEAVLRARVRQHGLGDVVTFAGWIEDKAAFFDSLDIYVLPSRYEEWGIGIVEAQAAGLPVVASACDGPRRIITHEQTGLLVPPGDAQALADAIERVATNTDLANALAKAGHAAVARYLMPAIAPLFAAEIRAAIARRTTG
jgi:glycosyltransferase involved in cell wall biosynthesis